MCNWFYHLLLRVERHYRKLKWHVQAYLPRIRATTPLLLKLLSSYGDLTAPIKFSTVLI